MLRNYKSRCEIFRVDLQGSSVAYQEKTFSEEVLDYMPKREAVSVVFLMLCQDVNSSQKKGGLEVCSSCNKVDDAET